MERITFKNAYGASIVIDYDGPYILSALDGFDAVEINSKVTKGFGQIGYTLEGVDLGVRIMTINYMLACDSLQEAYSCRAAAVSVFNPLAGNGVLTYENDAVQRAITCAVTAIPKIVERNGILTEYSVVLTAQNPLFYDPIATTQLVQDFVSGLRFPIRFNPTIRFSRRGDALNPNIIGDVPSPIRIEFRGGCTNPQITNTTTGEIIRVGSDTEPVTLDAGDKLIVNTSYGQKTADLIRSDGSIERVDGYISDDSTFFSLPLGRSKITFLALSGQPQAYVSYRNWWLGV